VSNTHPADEPRDRRRIKHVPDHAVRLALVESAARPAGDNAAGILAAVLE
jgi:hypothetical protein